MAASTRTRSASPCAATSSASAPSPTDEDRDWLPDIAGNGDAYGTLRDIWANYRDESFISQYPVARAASAISACSASSTTRTRRRWTSPPSTTSAAIARSAARCRRHYDIAYRDPDIQIVDVDLAGDRKLILQHRVLDGVTLEENDAERVLQHVADLWGYDVKLIEADDAGTLRAEHTAIPRRPFM